MNIVKHLLVAAVAIAVVGWIVGLLLGAFIPA